jgi:hypothetical protein
MRRARAFVAALVFSSASSITPEASAQDLFELEVFPYETTPPGNYDVEFHANAMSKGSIAAASPLADHRPLHLSVEVTRGWTNNFETAVFIQTAPFASSGGATLAGGHLRTKVRLGAVPGIPLRAAISAEYTFNRIAFDQELQTFEIRPILDHRQGRLSLMANPSLEWITRGLDDEREPIFDLSARAAWQFHERVALAAEYYSAAATTLHLRPEVDAHRLVFGGIDLNVGSGWELAISAGHCVTSSEPWLMKSVVGYRF